MMKFDIVANDSQHEGFKLKTQADNEKELEVIKMLSEKLIEKITKIEIKITNSGY